MNLIELIQRLPKPEPWKEGDNIPWNDPDFSERMLNEHLSQAHDAASRRFELIDEHVAWIHRDLLGGKPAKILDLGCGPGLYAQRLARLGHEVTGIDFGPASLRYAREAAEKEGLACNYVQADVRAADYGEGFDLVMQIYGELNVFSPADIRLILGKAQRALKESGLLLMEVHDFATVKRLGETGTSWLSSKAGLFSDQPHLVLNETFWDEDAQAAIERMFVIDGASAEVSMCSLTYQAYHDEEYARLFELSGFEQVQFFPAMGGDLSAQRGDVFPVLARKQAFEG